MCSSALASQDGADDDHGGELANAIFEYLESFHNRQ
jgi:hypothetical protein